MPSIIELPEIVSSLEKADEELFERFFVLQSKIGKLACTEKMKPSVEKSFGSVSAVERQKIIKIFSRFTFETALFNELRAKRPHIVNNSDDLKKEIDKSKDDTFCNVAAMTPADTFGRVKGKNCITCSNFAKYDALHSVLIFKKHDPLDFSEKEIIDYIATAERWFAKANKSNKQAIYPYLMWNCLWRAGAGMVHGHMQMVLGEGLHYAEAELYNKIRKEYATEFNSGYFADLYKIHKALGLGFERKRLKILMNIVPKKEKEITIISDSMDSDFSKAIYAATRCLVDDFGVNSFNLGILLPPIGKNPEWKGFPVLAKIVDRGSLGIKTCDIGGMEMYAGSNVIEADPYNVFSRLLERS